MNLLQVKGIEWDTTLYSAVIAAVVSFIVWILTVGHDNYKKRLEKNRTDKSNLTYLSFLLVGATSSANQQLHRLRQYITDFDESLHLDYEPLSILPHLDLQTLSSRLDQEKYFNSYVSIYKKSEAQLESIKNVFTSVYYLQIQFNSLKEMTESFYKEESSNSVAFSELFSSTLYLIGELRFLKETSGVLDFLNSANRIQGFYMAQRKSEADFNSAFHDFILPLMGLLAVEYTHSVFTREIASNLYKARAIGERMIKNRVSYKKEIAGWFNRTVPVVAGLQKDILPIVDKYIHINRSSSLGHN